MSECCVCQPHAFSRTTAATYTHVSQLSCPLHLPSSLTHSCFSLTVVAVLHQNNKCVQLARILKHNRLLGNAQGAFVAQEHNNIASAPLCVFARVCGCGGQGGRRVAERVARQQQCATHIYMSCSEGREVTCAVVASTCLCHPHHMTNNPITHPRQIQPPPAHLCLCVR